MLLSEILISAQILAATVVGDVYFANLCSKTECIFGINAIFRPKSVDLYPTDNGGTKAFIKYNTTTQHGQLSRHQLEWSSAGGYYYNINRNASKLMPFSSIAYGIDIEDENNQTIYSEEVEVLKLSETLKICHLNISCVTQNICLSAKCCSADNTPRTPAVCWSFLTAILLCAIGLLLCMSICIVQFWKSKKTKKIDF